MIDLSFKQISEYNKSKVWSKGYSSLNSLLNKFIGQKAFRHDPYAVHHGMLVLTGDAQLRKNKLHYYDEEDHCHYCGKKLIYKPYDLYASDMCICSDCDKKLGRDLKEKNIIGFSSEYGGRLEIHYSKHDLITIKIADMPDKTQSILNIFKACI